MCNILTFVSANDGLVWMGLSTVKFPQDGRALGVDAHSCGYKSKDGQLLVKDTKITSQAFTKGKPILIIDSCKRKNILSHRARMLALGVIDIIYKQFCIFQLLIMSFIFQMMRLGAIWNTYQTTLQSSCS